MQFFSIAAILLSLGSQVLAAPFVPASNVEIVPRDANVFVKDIEARLTSRLASLESESSEISERNQPSGYPISIVTGAVATLSANVTFQLTTIKSCAVAEFDEEVALKIKASLEIIAASFNEAIILIGPILKGSFELLAEAEIKLLLQALVDIKLLLTEIDATITFLAGVAVTEAKLVLLAELAIVKGLILAFITPLAGFAFHVAAFIKGAFSAQLTVSASACISVGGKVVTSIGLIH